MSSDCALNDNLISSLVGRNIIQTLRFNVSMKLTVKPKGVIQTLIYVIRFANVIKAFSISPLNIHSQLLQYIFRSTRKTNCSQYSRPYQLKYRIFDE